MDTLGTLLLRRQQLQLGHKCVQHDVLFVLMCLVGVAGEKRNGRFVRFSGFTRM
jgi:hypothetical protein